MPRNREIYYVMSAVENWKAEMLIRMEGCIKSTFTCNEQTVKLFIENNPSTRLRHLRETMVKRCSELIGIELLELLDKEPAR